MAHENSTKIPLREWLGQGPFTLALSSSFFGFYAHAGFAEALYGEGFKPNKLTGSSAGALVAAGLASGLSTEQMRELIFDVKREDFWDPGIGIGFLRGKKFRRHIEPHFASTFANTKTALEISVFDVLSMRTQFLNQGSVAQAVVASCAVPLMFHPVRIGKRFYLDGGLRNKSGVHPSGERILCVYLESSGAAGAYERKTGLPKLYPDLKVLRFTDFPRVSFNSLVNGRKAYREIRERGRRALDQAFAGSVLNI